MTVKALVDRLKSYPQDSVIYLENPPGIHGPARKMGQLCQYENNKYREEGVYFE